MDRDGQRNLTAPFPTWGEVGREGSCDRGRGITQD